MTVTKGPEPDAAWFAVVASWIEQCEELLVAYTPAGSGGSTGYFFCRSIEEVKHIVERVPEAARVLVYRRHRLSVRGVVDNAFIQSAMGAIPPGRAFLLVSMERNDYAYGFEAYDGDTHEELDRYLHDCFGETVALGTSPEDEGGEEGRIRAYKGGMVGAY